MSAPPSSWTTPLFTAHMQSIIVDKNTRRPTAGPDWWRKLQSHVTTHSEPFQPERLPVSGRPPVSSDYSQRVSASDADQYAHLSWAHAVKICYNALVLHFVNQQGGVGGKSAADGGGKSGSGLDGKVKSLTAIYLKEVPLGAKLGVSIWDRDGSPDLFDFQIQRDGKVATEVQIEFSP